MFIRFIIFLIGLCKNAIQDKQSASPCQAVHDRPGGQRARLRHGLRGRAVQGGSQHQQESAIPRELYQQTSGWKQLYTISVSEIDVVYCTKGYRI